MRLKGVAFRRVAIGGVRTRVAVGRCDGDRDRNPLIVNLLVVNLLATVGGGGARPA
ncbi:hypothetical protein [Streptomyces sp. CC224B]|uniref:hypothetical protein n=1 Tax=Streptomyces sp. CC224B TaxID=3044571 RepID=UPI0024A97E7C|nr:hypothetical protein [Streptomyces sp. CC224B]